MYAVIHSGGKQYRVADGLKLKLEKLPVESGQAVEFDKVLMVVDGENVQLGAPYLANAKVMATVCGHGRHDKIKIIKLRRRKHYRRQQGHRQDYTEVEITGIQAA